MSVSACPYRPYIYKDNLENDYIASIEFELWLFLLSSLVHLNAFWITLSIHFIVL